VRRALLVAALVLVTGGCGSGTRPAAPPANEWRANARQLVEQLRVDIAGAAVAGTTRASAAHALRDVSDLYALLVAYSDLGGCRAMVTAAAPPEAVVSALEPACTHLQRAASLFARAAQRKDPDALLRAGRETGRAEPQLVRAMLAIRRD